MTLSPNKIIIAFAGLLMSLFTYAQQIEVKGTIIDETTKEPIDFATVQIEETKNHRLLGYGFSDDKGNFVIETELKEETDVSLVITYIGFTTYKRNIPLNKLHYNAGQIVLTETAETLDAVVITAKPPILIKNDTMQFNASSFKTKEDAVAEDLLKKLPGVSVDNDDGSIKVNGIDVTRILVNGEPFFSNNPQVAMKIISKDIIEKIEVTNTKSDENEFTGNEDEEEAKTINIILKKLEQGNMFGDVLAGLGTDKRYESNAVFNRMLNKSFFTILAFSNNVNKNNFSYDDEAQNTLDRNKAIKTETNVGSNYSNKFDGGDRLNINYMFSDTKYDKGTREDRISLVPSNPNSRISETDDITEQQIHKFDFKMINNVFQNFRLITRTNFYSKDRDFFRTSESETKNQAGDFVNGNYTDFDQFQNTTNIFSNISAIYKLEKINAYINYRIGTGKNMYNAFSKNKSTTFFESKDDVIRDQEIDQKRNDFNSNHFIKYNQRFLNNNFISYEFSTRKDDKAFNKQVADYNMDNGSFENNQALSFDQHLDITKEEHKLAYEYRKKSLYFNAKASKLRTELGNRELDRDLELVKTFSDYLYSSKLRYTIKSGFTLNANYRTKSIVPKNNELLTITDNTNPLFITIGNPDLKRELEHLFSVNIRTFNKKSKVFFFNRFSYTKVADKIINQSTVDEELVTTRTYVNNSDNYKYSMFGSLSKDYKKAPLFYSFKMKWFASMSENAHITNNVFFKSHSVTFTPSFYADINYNDLIEINPTYRLFLDNTRYDTDLVANQSNVQHTFGLNITTFAPERFTLFNQMQYNLNPKFEEGLGRQSLVWNITANYSLVPNKAKLKFTVFNLLNQYNNTNRALTDSRNSTYTYDVLKQYFMFSFKYIFKNS